MAWSEDRAERLSKAIGYRFRDGKLLQTALTHSSYVNENKLRYNENNERLEFLGDAVLDAVISEYLYREYPEAEEGGLTKQRAAIVCEQALNLCAKKLELGQYLILGKGEEHNGGRTRPSMNADAVEAIIGAVFIEAGWEQARETAMHILKDVIREAAMGHLNRDYKSLVQELIQAKGESDIRYEVVREEGPDHSKTFTIDLVVGGKVLGQGSGKSKKEAEQQAAKAVFENGDV
ncbi:MAG: ribonuclease III [Firmicutes bacterium]|nr:ribonuclease III [Bacillota bacterium]